MSAAPLLLQRLAQAADGLLRGGYLLVQDGEGFEDLPETVPLKSGASARVVRIDSELALRHAIWKARPASVIAVVPETLDLPADLKQGAERRRVHTLSGDEVLSALLGTDVRGVDDADLRALAIEHADPIRQRLSAKTTPTMIDRALLERTLVEVMAELQDLRSATTGLSELLERWVLDPPTWPEPVRRLAARTLEQSHGDAGRVLGWALEDPATRCRALLVHGALLGVEGDVPPPAWGPLAELADERRSNLRAPRLAREFVVQLAVETAGRMGHSARPLLDEADGLAGKILTSSILQTSKLLPLAFEERAHAVATGLANGEPASREDLHALRAHAIAGTAERELQLLDDLDRLVRYLRFPRAAATSAAQMARSYLADHAHADRCARRVERALASVTAHHAEAKAVLARVFAVRDEANEAYARALAKGYAAALFDRSVVALQYIVSSEVLPHLREGGRVFLLVLDGCSVPVFLDLLDQLVGPKLRVGLDKAKDLSLHLRAGLAPLPTITSHARGAIFLGAIPKDPFAAETHWREEGERKTDPARFKQNKALDGVTRELFLKGELADGGVLLRAALRGPTSLVAAVFNAVDDRIGSHDTGAAWRLEVDDIAGLLPSLKDALDTGRRILLTADHGHTPFRGTALRVEAGPTPRYVRLKAEEAVPDGFAEIDCGDLAGEPGRTAFGWRSGAYRGKVQVGFHGGCSLEEMVVPVAWLTRDGVGADKPPWWFDVGAAATPAPAPVRAPQSSKPSPMELPFAKPSAPSHRLPVLMRTGLEPDEIQAVAWILADGPIRTSVLAKRLGRPAQRVQGWLTKLNRKLLDLGGRLEAETLADLEQQWRYVGPSEDA